MVRKHGRFLRCMFSFAILGVALHKTWQNTKLVTCAHTTNQKKKDCDYVIYAKSMSIKRHKGKMNRVNGLPT